MCAEHLPAEDHAGHTHGTDCGHPAIQRDDHTDYLHNGHLHQADGDH